MQKEIYIDTTGRVVNETDWEGKANEIIAKLDEEVFDKISDEDVYGEKKDFYGNVIKWKKAIKRNELKPTLSPTQITTKLTRYMLIYRPMDLRQAETLEPEDYIKANLSYLDIISHINDYITYLPSKQELCQFINITVDTYNQLLENPKYTDTFKAFEGSFINNNFNSAQAGMIDSKTTITKLQTKDEGHSLVKSPESVTLINTTKIDKVEIGQKFEQAMGLLNLGKGKK